MIAQQVEEVFPEWVGTDADGYKTLTYRGFEALTVESLRELSAENSRLSTKVATLEDRLSALEKRAGGQRAGLLDDSRMLGGAAVGAVLASWWIRRRRRRSPAVTPA